jgi:hypothetical protein
VVGDSPAVNRWLESIREHKTALVEILKAASPPTDEEKAIRDWLAAIGEEDPDTIAEVLPVW